MALESGSMPKFAYTIGKSTSLPANAFAKKEYVFTGWNTQANRKGVTFKNMGSLGAYDVANGSTVRGDEVHKCVVTDQYDNRDCAYFYPVSHSIRLTSSTGEIEVDGFCEAHISVTKKMGEDLTLKTIVLADDISSITYSCVCFVMKTVPIVL